MSLCFTNSIIRCRCLFNLLTEKLSSRVEAGALILLVEASLELTLLLELEEFRKNILM